MKKINLSEESYIKLKKKLNEEVDPFYDVRTSFEDFKAAFDQCVVEVSLHNGNRERTLPTLLEVIRENVNFDAIEDALYT